MAPTIQPVGTGTPSEKRTPSSHSTPVPPRPAERRSELVCRVKYNNTLPDIPFHCKFIAYPFESTRFIEYKSTSLERNYKYEVLTEHDLGVTIDLINKDTYAPNYNIQLDPADEKLLEEDIITPQDSKRSRHHARSVSWLRRTEYISTEQTRFQPQVMDKVEAKVGFSIKKNFKDDTLYMDRESQVKAIEKTFADSKLPIEKHYSKPSVTPVEIMPVYPDFKYWKYPCAQVIFDSDPASQGRPVPARIEEMSQAMIRGVMDESGEQFVAYFLPTTETLDKRKLDVLNSVEYADEQEYEYKMAREYNWNVKSKSCKGYEENYFLIVRDDAVYYNELETSPSGKLVQIEYALAAVEAGAPSVGIKASNGIVLATEKKQKSILYEDCIHKVEPVTDYIGMVYSGMGPDYRLLVKKARKIAQQYKLIYQENIPTQQLVQRVAAIMQEYTQSGGVRPFGVSLLICGWDHNRPSLYQCDPSGAYFAWKATAMGRNYINGKTFLEKRYSEDLELDDAVHTAILTLKEGFEGQMTAENIEIGIADESGFRRLDVATVQDHLSNIPQ